MNSFDDCNQTVEIGIPHVVCLRVHEHDVLALNASTIYYYQYPKSYVIIQIKNRDMKPRFLLGKRSKHLLGLFAEFTNLE